MSKKPKNQMQGQAMQKKSNLGQVKLYDEVEQPLTIEQQFIVASQQKILEYINKKGVDIDLFSIEQVFFDLFQKQNKVNKKTLDKAKTYYKIKLTKQFINTFDYINTPSKKDYEQKLLESVNAKFIVDYIKKNGNYMDKKDLHIIKNLLQKIEDIKLQYRRQGQVAIENSQYLIDKIQSQKIVASQDSDKIKDYKLNNYKLQKAIAKDYKKLYDKLTKKQVKSRYRLCKKYKFLDD